MPKLPEFSLVKIAPILVGLVLFLTLAATLFPASATGYYPPGTQLTYSGMVKPRRNLPEYHGIVEGLYSTVFTGNYQTGGEGSGSHPGVDITGTCATENIYSIAEGEVVAIVRDWRETHPGVNACGDNRNLLGFGNYILVRNDHIPYSGDYGGTVWALYAHLYYTTNLSVGEKVFRGTLLGQIGSTGGSGGPHLHLQLETNRTPSHPYWPGGLTWDEVDQTDFQATVLRLYVNPMRYIQQRLVQTDFLSNYRYFTNISLALPFYEQGSASRIDHDWLNSRPVPPYIGNNFSASWEGDISIPKDTHLEFFITAADGVKLYVDNQLLMSDWQDRDPPRTLKIITPTKLTTGGHTIKLEFYTKSGLAVTKLAWRSIALYIPNISKPFASVCNSC